MVVGRYKYKKIYKLWESFTEKSFYDKPFPKFNNKRKSLLDFDKIYDDIDKFIKKDDIKKSPINGFATLTQIKDAKIKNQINISNTKLSTRKLNAAKDPIKVVLASSSVPILFGATKINDKTYVDGGIQDNIPINPLIKEKCNILIVVPLGQKTNYDEYKNKDVFIIDLNDPSIFPKLLINKIKDSITFNIDYVDNLIDKGYKNTIKVLKKLKKIKFLDKNNNFNVDIDGFMYYSLKKGLLLENEK